MQTTPFSRQSPVPCPQWCSPVCHFEDPAGALHTSAAVTVTAGSERWTLDLLQSVDYSDPDEPGSVELRIQVVDTVWPGCDAEHLFPVGAVPALAHRLMTEYHRARLLSAPAVAGPCLGDAA